MGLGPLLANVFMFSLEELIVPTLKDCLVHLKRYVHDTFCIFAKLYLNENFPMKLPVVRKSNKPMPEQKK